MTVASELSRKSYSGDGSTTSFGTSPMVFFDTSDLTVYVVLDSDGSVTTLTENTHYTVTGGDGSTGTVNLAGGSSPYGAPAAGRTLLIVRDLPATQATDYVNNSASDANVLEESLDRLTMLVQQNQTSLARVLRQPDTDTADIDQLPVKQTRASKYLAFDADGDPIATAGTTEANPVSSFMATVLDDTTAAAARTTLDVPSNSEAVLDTIFDAKGDLLVATAADTPARKAVGSNGDMLAPSSSATDGLAWVGQGAHLFNGTWSVSVAASALTIALKTDGGADPSAADSVFVAMPNTTGGFTVYTITAATSLVLSSGSTLGTVSAQAHRIYFGFADDGGTLRLWAYNPWDNTNTALLGVIDGVAYSSTAEGGAGAADSAQTFYSATAFTTKVVRTLGYFESTQATAGTWATAPSAVRVLKPGDRRTGDVVQTKRERLGTVVTGTTTMPHDDTIPQNTEGTEFIDITITPTSAINLLHVKALLIAATSAGAFLQAALFRDATAGALASVAMGVGTVSRELLLPLEHRTLAGSTSATTFDVRAGAESASTVTVNGVAGGQIHGGVMNSHIEAAEIFV